MNFLSLAVMSIMTLNCFTCGLTCSEDRYCDSGEQISITSLNNTYIDVPYISKNEDNYRMVLSHPRYTTSPYVSACACIAGANVIGYFDRYDENLIPNHISGQPFAGDYIYQVQDEYITQLVGQLYTDMGTTSSGTTVDEFKNGMKKYCGRKGKNITFSSCMNSNGFDYSRAQSYMKNNMPIVLFLSGYNIANISTDNNQDTINYYESKDNHVMVGFGYKAIQYSVSGGQDEYHYISVATGLVINSNGLFDIAYKTNINNALAISIQ